MNIFGFTRQKHGNQKLYQKARHKITKTEIFRDKGFIQRKTKFFLSISEKRHNCLCEANPRKRVTIIRFNCCLVKFMAKILKFTGFNQNLLLSNTLRTNRFSKMTFTVPKNSPKVAKPHSKFLVPVWFVSILWI